ncbi:hypothetical protein [uncultured Cyclobacterium sp.]|uniref:hypothetical protein n=1 Tax=uncultured Cyclobacterium sp. TaxID=453820 RepID=UPI0030EE0DF8
MKSKRHFIKNSIQNPFLIGTSLASCFLMLLFGPIFLGANSTEEISESSNQQVSFLSANDILSDIHYFLHFPFEGDSPEEQESENESNKTLDEDSESFYVNSAFFSKAGYNLEKTLFSQLSLSIHNRSKISLVILYHSWKSFLA